jgi:hypothetical protein
VNLVDIQITLVLQNGITNLETYKSHIANAVGGAPLSQVFLISSVPNRRALSLTIGVTWPRSGIPGSIPLPVKLIITWCLLRTLWCPDYSLTHKMPGALAGLSDLTWPEAAEVVEVTVTCGSGVYNLRFLRQNVLSAIHARYLVYQKLRLVR